PAATDPRSARRRRSRPPSRTRGACARDPGRPSRCGGGAWPHDIVIAGVRISVVLPYYNRSRFIDECLDSGFPPNPPPHEVIVVDDASRLDDRRHVERLRPRIRLVQLGRNRGVSGARNAGVAAARGDWIAFQDSDDLWEPDKLARQWSHLEANAGCDGVQS